MSRHELYHALLNIIKHDEIDNVMQMIDAYSKVEQLQALINELKEMRESIKEFEKNPDEGWSTKEHYQGQLQQISYDISKLENLLK